MTDEASDSVEKPEVVDEQALAAGVPDDEEQGTLITDEGTEQFVADVDDDVKEIETPNIPAIVDVLSEDPADHPSQRRRKVVRREDRPLSAEERHEIDDEIVKSNTELRRLETEKKAMDKKYNGEIAEQRQILDDAIDVLGKDVVFADMVRMEVFDYEVGQVFYFDEAGEELVDERPMTPDERQTKMAI